MNLLNTSIVFLHELGKALKEIEKTGSGIGPVMSHVLLIGNGGSAAVAAHICNDLNNKGRPAIVPDYATITAFANDRGWEKAIGDWTVTHTMVDSTLIAISSSGRSKNIIDAVDRVSRYNCPVITFTGFDSDNPLRKLGNLNYWVPSHNYGIVECAHLALLHSIVNPGEL